MDRDRSPTPGRDLGLAVVVLFLAAFLRLHDLGAASLWLDEAHSYNRAALPDWSAIYPVLRAKNHAPLYDAVVLHHWLRLGSGEFVLRLPAAFFGLATVALTHVAGRRLFGPAVALIAALLLAFSPVHVYYSREARMYTQVTFFVTLAVYLLLRALSGPPRASWPYWLGYSLSAALALYTHYFAGFVLIALALFAIVHALLRRRRPLLLTALFSHVGVALLFAPWLPTFWAQLNANPVAWLPEPDAELLSRILSRFFLEREFLGGVFPYWQVFLALALLGGFVFAWRQQRGEPPFAHHLAYIVTVTAGSLFIALAVSLVKPLILGRYLLVIVPQAVLLAAVCCVALWRRHVARPVSLLILLGVIVSGYGVATAEAKPDWRALAAYLEREATPADVIVVYPGNLGVSLDHYYDGQQERVHLSPDVSAAAVLGSLTAGRVWLVGSSTAESDLLYQEMVASADTHLQRQSCRSFGSGGWHAHLCLYQNEPGSDQ